MEKWTWIQDHWMLLTLIISEGLAFIPAKWNGVAQSVLRILGSIFKKKSDE